ncbi:MAG: NYN domain-containing protein [Gemmataceae bacterium]
MSFLIDGYNLLYALGRLTRRSSRAAAVAARRWLADQLSDVVTVVFDGTVPGDEVRELQRRTQARIRFSGGQSADDLIEDLIAAEARPRELTVVSNDHRLQTAARRRGCNVLTCLDYYEQQVMRPRTPAAPVPVPAEDDVKPEAADADTEQWIEAFRMDDDDPLLRDPF